MAEKLKDILQRSKSPGGKGFSQTEIDSLSKYYELVLKWNPRLHLTTLIQPQAFFERHIFESAFSASLLQSSINQIWDLGSGLGAPGMILAILRPELTIRLVESSRNKAFFLEEAAFELGLRNVSVIESRFESIERISEFSCLTVRAIEEMDRLVPQILKLGGQASQIFIFGAVQLEEKARRYLAADQTIELHLIPNSTQRYIINIFRST
jgi:16S rRNA (guanine527-N7)-methyltransferase